MFPIKYIDNNLVWNKDNEVFAYYELIPYNYSFLSAEQKFIVHDSFRQLIAQSREGKIHALQIATESSGTMSRIRTHLIDTFFISLNLTKRYLDNK